MTNFELYLRRFFAIASKSNTDFNKRDFLSRLISYEEQDLTEGQQDQTQINIGINLLYKTGNMVLLAKGTHNIEFDVPFTGTYIIIPYGSTGSASFAPIITDVSNLEYFTVKMPITGYLSWIGFLTTETS